MKRFRTCIVLLVVAILIISSVGCSQNKGGTDNAGTQTPSAGAGTTGQKAEEVISPTFFIPCGSYLYTGDELVFKEIEKATNIKFKPISVPIANYNEKLSTTLASGELPDLIGMRNSKDLQLYGPQGAFADLKQYMDKGEMPDFKATLEKFPPAMALSKAGDGKIYGAPRIYDMDFRADETLLVRWDILSKNNIPMPNTFDELYQALKKLKTIYPDSTPYTSRWEFSNAIQGQTQFRNTDSSIFLNHETNQYEFGPLSQAYKDSLAFLRDAYRDGLLDKDFLTLSDEQWTEKMATGKAFFTYDYPQACDEIVQSNGNQLEAGWDLRTMPQPMYGDKKYGTVILKGYFGYSKAISAKSKYVDRLVKFLNWTYTKPAIDLLQFGVEGDTYTRDANGAVKMASDIKYSGNPNGTRDRVNLGLNDQSIFSVLNEEARDTYEIGGEQMRKSMATIKDDKLYGEPYYSLTIPSVESAKRYDEIRLPLVSYVEESSAKVITGKMTLDQWDSEVIPKLKDMHVEEALKIANDAYKEVMSR